MQTESEAVSSSKVDFTFNLAGGSCSASILIQSSPGRYNCGDGSGPHAGYAIVNGGTITYTLPGQTASNTLPFIPHFPGGQDYQVLWADGCGIPGGSSNGIAQTGPYFGRGMPSLSWVKDNQFSLNLGATSYDLTLASCKGWPPASGSGSSTGAGFAPGSVAQYLQVPQPYQGKFSERCGRVFFDGAGNVKTMASSESWLFVFSSSGAFNSAGYAGSGLLMVRNDPMGAYAAVLLGLYPSKLNSQWQQTAQYTGNKLTWTPAAMALDAAGNVYVVASSQSSSDVSLVKLSSDLSTVLWQSQTIVPYVSGGTGPFAIAVDADGVSYVLNTKSNKVHPVDASGNPLPPWSVGSPSRDLAFDNTGRLYVAVGGNVVQYSKAGAQEGSTQILQSGLLTSISFDAKGTLWGTGGPNTQPFRFAPVPPPAPTPTTLEIVSGNNQIVQANVYNTVAIPAPLEVVLKDGAGHPVAGKTIQWSYARSDFGPGPAAQVAVPATSQTDPNGNATATGTVQLSPFGTGGTAYIQASYGSLSVMFSLAIVNSNG